MHCTNHKSETHINLAVRRSSNETSPHKCVGGGRDYRHCLNRVQVIRKIQPLSDSRYSTARMQVQEKSVQTSSGKSHEVATHRRIIHIVVYGGEVDMVKFIGNY